VMVCALLLQKGLFTSARQSVEFFNRMRGGGNFAFEYPSQVRYVDYLESLNRLTAIEVSQPVGSKSVPIDVDRVRLYLTADDTDFPTTSDVRVVLSPPEQWNDGPPPRSDGGGQCTILPRVAHSGSDTSSEQSAAFIDFVPREGSRARILGDIKLSVAVDDVVVASACFHSSMAGSQPSSKSDTEVFPLSQVEKSASATTASECLLTATLVRGMSVHLRIASRSPKPVR